MLIRPPLTYSETTSGYYRIFKKLKPGVNGILLEAIIKQVLKTSH